MFQKARTQPLSQVSACVSGTLTGKRHKRMLAPACTFGGLPTEIVSFKKAKPARHRKPTSELKRIDTHFLAFLAALAFCLPPHFCAAQQAKSVRAALPATQRANASLTKESRKLLQVGDAYSKAEQYAQALQYYTQVALQHPDDLHVCYQLGECHRHLFNYTLAEAAYGKVSYADTATHPEATFYYALMQKMNGKYARAIQGFGNFIKNASGLDEAKLPGKKQWLDRAKLEQDGCQFALLREKFAQGDFDFKGVSAPVSSPAHDYAPMLAGSDSAILITSGRSDRKKPLDGRLGEGFSDFHRYARQTDTAWIAAADKLLTVNTQWNDGTGCLSADGTRFYFTRCQGSDVNCAIFTTEYKNSRWQKPVRLNAHINQPGSDSRHPALSPRGDTLYFVSDRAGGFGMNDIWRSVRASETDWSQPTNLGNKVNTAQNDISPFLYPAANQLFFASDGWLGLGGLDIYYLNLSDNIGVRAANNLGPPFNSNRDDAFMVLGSEKGFLASNREGGMGNFDIYTFFNKSRYVELLALNKTRETLRPDLAYLSEFQFEYLPDVQKLMLDRLVGKKTAGKLYQTDMPLTEEETYFHARLSASEKERLERMINTLFSRRDTAALKAEDDYRYGKLLAEADRQQIGRFAEAYRLALRDGAAPDAGGPDKHFYESLTHEERHQLHRQIAARLGGRTSADGAGLLDEDGYFYEKLTPQEKDRIARMAAARHAARLNAHDEVFRDEDADFYAKLPPDDKKRLDRILDRSTYGWGQPLDSSALSDEDRYFYAQLSAEEKQRLNRMAAARHAARLNGTDETFRGEDRSHYEKLPPDEKDRMNRFAAAWITRNHRGLDGSLLSEEDLFKYEKLTPQEKERLDRMAAARHAARLNGKSEAFSEADQYYYESLSPGDKARMDRMMQAREASKVIFGDATLLASGDGDFAFARMPLENSIPEKGQTRRVGTKLMADESMINGTTADDALSKLNASWLGKYKEVTLSGRLMDAQTNRPAAGLSLPLVNGKGKIVKTTTTNADGTFQYLNLPLSEDLHIRIETPPTLLTDSPLLYVEDMQLTAHKNASTAAVSKPAYFDFDSYVLKTTTGRLLDSLVEFYSRNPGIQIELNAFADEVGAEDYNLRLSNKRGLAVQKYLVGKGVLPGSIVIYARGEANAGGSGVPNRTAPRRNAAQRKVTIAIQDMAIETRQDSETFVILPETELSVIAGKVKIPMAELRRLNGFKTDTVEPYRPIRIR